MSEGSVVAGPAAGKGLPVLDDHRRRLRDLALAIRAELAAAGADRDGLARALDRIHVATQPAFAQAARCGGVTPVCRAGCASCCYQPVDVAWVEALRIAQAVAEGTDRDAVTERLRAYVRDLATHEAASTRPFAEACPFLSAEGRCSIHAVRPMVCRGYNSGELAECLEFAASGFQTRPRTFNKAQADVGRAARAALALAGPEDEARIVNLARGVLRALESRPQPGQGPPNPPSTSSRSSRSIEPSPS